MHDQLAAEAYDILNRLSDHIRKQKEAFNVGEDDRFMRLDRKLENMIGEKERAVGALRQHDQEHGCQQ